MVHGDDFKLLGFDDELDKIEGCFKEWYDVKVRGRVGADEGDLHENDERLNGRVACWSTRRTPSMRRR